MDIGKVGTLKLGASDTTGVVPVVRLAIKRDGYYNKLVGIHLLASSNTVATNIIATVRQRQSLNVVVEIDKEKKKTKEFTIACSDDYEIQKVGTDGRLQSLVIIHKTMMFNGWQSDLDLEKPKMSHTYIPLIDDTERLYQAIFDRVKKIVRSPVVDKWMPDLFAAAVAGGKYPNCAGYIRHEEVNEDLPMNSLYQTWQASGFSAVWISTSRSSWEQIIRNMLKNGKLKFPEDWTYSPPSNQIADDDYNSVGKAFSDDIDKVTECIELILSNKDEDRVIDLDNSELANSFNDDFGDDIATTALNILDFLYPGMFWRSGNPDENNRIGGDLNA